MSDNSFRRSMNAVVSLPQIIEDERMILAENSNEMGNKVDSLQNFRLFLSNVSIKKTPLINHQHKVNAHLICSRRKRRNTIDSPVLHDIYQQLCYQFRKIQINAQKVSDQ